MLWHLTSKFCVLSCKLVLAWEPWGNAGGTATGSPSWVRCPIRGKDFFSFCCGILSLLYFHCFNAYFFLALHSIQGELYIHKMGAFLWKIIKTEADRRLSKTVLQPEHLFFSTKSPRPENGSLLECWLLLVCGAAIGGHIFISLDKLIFF